MPIKHVGYSIVPTPVKLIHLHRILLITQHHNLLSIRKLCCDNNCSVAFDSDFVHYMDNTTDDVLLQAPGVGNVYPFYLPIERLVIPANLTFSSLGSLTLPKVLWSSYCS